MSTHNTVWRNEQVTWDSSRFNSGSVVALTSTNDTLVTWSLGATAFTVTNHTASVNGLPLEANASNSGTIDHYELRNTNGTIIKYLAIDEVTITGSTTVASGQLVRITTLNIVAPN